MRKLRNVVTLLSLLFCLTICTSTALAADERLGTVVDGSLLTEDEEASGSYYSRARGSILASGSGNISLTGTRKIKMSGDTTAYRTVSKVKVTLFLQRLEGGRWVHVKTLGPKSKSNAYYVSNSNTYSVAGGYYYRVYGAHTAINGSTTESGTSYSNGIWVS